MNDDFFSSGLAIFSLSFLTNDELMNKMFLEPFLRDAINPSKSIGLNCVTSGMNLLVHPDKKHDDPIYLFCTSQVLSQPYVDKLPLTLKEPRPAPANRNHMARGYLENIVLGQVQLEEQARKAIVFYAFIKRDV